MSVDDHEYSPLPGCHDTDLGCYQLGSRWNGNYVVRCMYTSSMLLAAGGLAAINVYFL